MILTPTKAMDYLTIGPGLANQKPVYFDGDTVFIGDLEDAPVDILKLGNHGSMEAARAAAWTEISMNELCEIVDPMPPYNHGGDDVPSDVQGYL